MSTDNYSSKTSLAYTGEVTISFTKNNKVFEIKKHNAGLPNLFRLIAKAIAGENTTSEKPIKLDLRYSTSTDYISFLNKPVPLSAIQYKVNEQGSWVTSITATISASDFTETISNLPTDSTFRLYLSSNAADLAYLPVDKTDLLNITPGTQALVYWVLKVENSSI